MKINTYTPDKHIFLQRLSSIAKPPKSVYVTGKLPDNHRPCVAIVGSRKPTSYGKEVTFKLAYELAKRGFIIISGLAYGVDSIAHKAALQAGGTTIAVLAHGLDSIYPARHTALAKEIVAQGGALVSEYPEGTPALQYRFLERNRLVSGLADGVIITEAAKRSGTLATMTFALDQGREVFAVPGTITSLLSVGPNSLIQQGAHPVLSYEDVINVLAPSYHAHTIMQAAVDTPLLTLLKQAPQGTDTLARTMKLDAQDILGQLTLLELEGHIYKHEDDTWHAR